MTILGYAGVSTRPVSVIAWGSFIVTNVSRPPRSAPAVSKCAPD